MMGCLPDQPAFRDLNHRIVGDLSFSRVLRDQAFFIGCHPAIEESHLNHLEEVINNFYKNL
jgi:CDP-6-deoxy-D-xylo-4-hexulose-3-dehydrase